MACASCGTGGCSTGGCQNKGLCASGSCNKMNAHDWLSVLDIDDPIEYPFVEVSFKNGSRKDFFKNPNYLITGDTVLVEVLGGGFDIGVITLSGDLVRLQMKKKFTNEDKIHLSAIRKANERDLEKLENKVDLERKTMVQARAIAHSLGLNIKIGDVEFQGDMKKATFFFTANGRVDFRELVRAYAKEFKVKIEMRQIGSRQESARIGGIGSCGRELCCSTWLSDFRSVNTTAARYQNIAINQTKLSGQCGRLKCCLNYELDTYLDALKHFPTHANVIRTQKGNASLVKTDIFKGIMYYAYDDISMRGVFHPLDKEKVKEVLALNKKGVLPDDLTGFTEIKDIPKEIGFADVTGEIELPNKKSKKKKKKAPAGRGPAGGGNAPRPEGAAPRENRGPKNEGGEGRENRPPRAEGSPQRENRGPRAGQENRAGGDNRNPRPDNRPQRENRPPRPVQENKTPPTEGGQEQKPTPSPNPARENRGPGRENRPPRPDKQGGRPASDASPAPDVPPMPDNGGQEGAPAKNTKKKKFFNRNKKNNNPS